MYLGLTWLLRYNHARMAEAIRRDGYTMDYAMPASTRSSMMTETEAGHLYGMSSRTIMHLCLKREGFTIDGLAPTAG